MTFSPFLCLIEEIMQCFFVNGAKIVFNSFRYNKSLKPKKERNGVSAKYCYITHELRLHQNDRCKRFTPV